MEFNKWLKENNVKPRLFLYKDNTRDIGFKFSDDNEFDNKCFESINTDIFGIHNDGTFAPIIIPVNFSGNKPDLMGVNELLPYEKFEEQYLNSENEFESNLISTLNIYVPYMDATLESYVMDKEAHIAYIASKVLTTHELNSFIEAAGYEPGDSFKDLLLNEVQNIGINITSNELFDKYAYEYNVNQRQDLIQKAKNALIRDELDKTFLSLNQVQIYKKDDIEINNNLNENNLLITSAGGLMSENGHTFLATLDKFNDIEKGLIPVKPVREFNNGLTKINFYTDHQIKLAAIWEANNLNLQPEQIKYDSSFGVLCVDISKLSEIDMQRLWTKNSEINRFVPINENLYTPMIVPGTVMLKSDAKEYNDIAEANEQAEEFDVSNIDTDVIDIDFES